MNKKSLIQKIQETADRINVQDGSMMSLLFSDEKVDPDLVPAAYLFKADVPFFLTRILKTNVPEFNHLLAFPKYHQFYIPKKSGGVREIFAPSDTHKKVLRRLNYYLQHYYRLLKPSCIHGFVMRSKQLEALGIVSNAERHVGAKEVLNIDLKDFFPSISAADVYRLFQSHLFPYSNTTAQAMTLLTTYQKALPAGSPTSPVLSNFICLPLDQDLMRFAEANHLTYTRYADDLTFSSKESISENTVLDIVNIILERGFKINDRKVRKQTSAQKQVVTGLIVNERVNIDRKALKNIRAMVHDALVNGPVAATKHHFGFTHHPRKEEVELFLQKLNGYMAFIRQVRGEQDAWYQRLHLSFEKVMFLHRRKSVILI